MMENSQSTGGEAPDPADVSNYAHNSSWLPGLGFLGLGLLVTLLPPLFDVTQFQRFMFRFVQILSVIGCLAASIDWVYNAHASDREAVRQYAEMKFDAIIAQLLALFRR